MEKIEAGTPIRVRDNEAQSLFGPVMECRIARHEPGRFLTIELDGRNVLDTDDSRHPGALVAGILEYIEPHARAGLIVNLATIREIERRHMRKAETPPSQNTPENSV